MLFEEEVKFDVAKAKKCSFTTTRPLIWAKTIEEHLRETTNPYFSSKYTSEDGLYIEYMLFNESSKEKKLTINIYVKTGVVLIQGDHYQFWAEKVFPVLRDQVETYARRKYFGHMGCLWNENITLKSSLRNLELDFARLSTDLDSVHKKSIEIGNEVKSVSDETTKCTVPECGRHTTTTTATAETAKTEVTTTSEEATAGSTSGGSNLTELETQITELRERVRRKVSEIKVPHPFYPGMRCPRYIWADMAQIHCNLSGIQETMLGEISTLKTRMDDIDQAFDSMSAHKQTNTATLKKIEGEQQNINVNMEGINKSLEEMKRKMKLAWYDFTI